MGEGIENKIQRAKEYKKKQVTYSLPHAIVEKLRKVANAKGVSMTFIVENLLEEYLEGVERLDLR